jgi:diaminopimelate epimerase
MIAQLAFTKMHGLGNDFVMVEDLARTLEFSADAVAWLCDRHFGIGADGLIVVRPATTPEADFYMHYFNADGSVAEMCGNGARCFAKYLVDHGLVPPDADSLVIETLGGLRPVTFTRDAAGRMADATIDMGAPVLAPADIPTTLAGERILDHPLDTPVGQVRLTAVSMGNPHAVIWVDDVDLAPVETVGPYIERHDTFPKGTNVEFAERVDAHTIRLRVWERGVGETLACGTGACATAVAGVLSGTTDRTVAIELPGGDLHIRWDENGRVYMTGSAATSFTGVVEMADDST